MSKTANTEPKPQKAFEPTPIQYLFKRSGIYVFRRKIPGTKNVKVVSLKTDDFERAKELHKVENDKFEESVKSGVDFKSDATAGELYAEILKEWHRRNTIGKLAGSTLRTYEMTWKKICRTWQDVESTSIKKIEKSVLFAWHTGLHENECDTHVNNAKIIWNAIYDLAIEKNLRFKNLAVKLERKETDHGEPKVLSDEELTQLLDAIISPGYPNAHKFDVRDSVEFLCFFGSRINEAANTLKTDVHLNNVRSFVWFRETKNGEARAVPITDQARPLIERLLKNSKRGEYLLPVAECYKTIYYVCEEILKWPEEKWPSHHSFRDVFATTMLEATNGDFFAVSRLLGHKDGGKLLSERYATLREKYAHAQVAKLNYGFAAKNKPQEQQVDQMQAFIEQLKAAKIEIPAELKDKIIPLNSRSDSALDDVPERGRIKTDKCSMS